jgi:phosphatidylinositol alpha 1,6-mannosyltransferase
VVSALLPKRQSEATEQKIEDLAMAAAAKFYSVAQGLVCAQPRAVRSAGADHGAQVLPDAARRGCGAVSPGKSQARPEDRDHVLGFVGRLSIEKNVTLLAQVQEELEAMGHKSFRFLIVGHGAEEGWLRDGMPRAEIPGVLKGEALSTAYANMDLFVFPSHTDTFGNVVLGGAGQRRSGDCDPRRRPMHHCSRRRNRTHCR